MINMNFFSIFSISYFILGIISLSLLDTILMANKLGVFVLIIFIYILISGIWSIVTSSSRHFLVVSLFYVLLTVLMARGADNNVFWPGRNQTIFISGITYIIFVLIWFGVKLLKKKFKN